MRPKPRFLKDLKRLDSYKNARDIALIVCEGAKTEPNYFKALRNHLKLSSIEVEICGKDCGPAPISVIEYAIDKKDEAYKSNFQLSYDKIWCVCDVEAPKRHSSLLKARDKAITNKIHFILSNPCFEYWYLMHFVKTSRAMNTNKEVRNLLKNYIRKYKKNDKKTFDVVNPLTQAAIKNSKSVLREKGWGEDLIECNPSTHVFRLVEYLHKIPKMPRQNKKTDL